MDDIVTALRESEPPAHWPSLYRRAADEIERLRANKDAWEELAEDRYMTLRALYEWYDRDGSVGGASEVFEAHRGPIMFRP